MDDQVVWLKICFLSSLAPNVDKKSPWHYQAMTSYPLNVSIPYAVVMVIECKENVYQWFEWFYIKWKIPLSMDSNEDKCLHFCLENEIPIMKSRAVIDHFRRHALKSLLSDESKASCWSLESASAVTWRACLVCVIWDVFRKEPAAERAGNISLC